MDEAKNSWYGTQKRQEQCTSRASGYADFENTQPGESLHRYGIVQAIHQSSGDEILVEEGSLYPALQRLEANGWVDGEWGLSQANCRARIYKHTGKGRKRLSHERRRYEQVTLAIARLMAQE
jgi:DNA-binding PadR family transcriptional regulator